MQGTLVATSVTLTVLAGVCGNSPGAANGIGTAATFSQPKGIAVDSNGNVFVGDYRNNLLRMITPGGVVSTVFTQTVGVLKSNDGVAVDSSNNVYFATGSSLMKYSSAGAVSVVASSGFSELAGIAINTATGVIYAADKGGYVWKFV
jgi:glucose/arabinose dehydrogenase